jgi:hypothetical protein
MIHRGNALVAPKSRSFKEFISNLAPFIVRMLVHIGSANWNA